MLIPVFPQATVSRPTIAAVVLWYVELLGTIMHGVGDEKRFIGSDRLFRDQV